jgi:hypothetical protein
VKLVHNGSGIMLCEPGKYKVEYRVIPSKECKNHKEKAAIGLELNAKLLNHTIVPLAKRGCATEGFAIIDVCEPAVLRLKNVSNCEEIKLNELEHCAPNVSLVVCLV